MDSRSVVDGLTPRPLAVFRAVRDTPYHGETKQICGTKRDAAS